MWKIFFLCVALVAVLPQRGCGAKQEMTNAATTQTTPRAGGISITKTDVASPYADLRNAILDGYDSQARPGTPEEPIIVELGLMVNAMAVEEWNSALHADVFFVMAWQDNRLTWEPESYSGIDTIRLSPASVWIPDIALQNEIPTFSSALQAIQKNVLVRSNGTVLWVPSVSLKAACELDLIKFPRDRQRCTMIFGSWTYDKSEIDLKLTDDPINTDDFVNSSPWYIAASFAEKRDNTYPKIPGLYPAARFTFYMHRRLTPYCISLYTPVFAVVLASISTFFLWRSICGTGMIMITLLNAIILTTVIMYHGLTMRVSACGVPCIMKFIGGLMALEALMLPLKAITVNITSDVRGQTEKTAKPLPKSLALLVALPTFWRRKGKGEAEAYLLSSEIEKKNVEDWMSARYVLGSIVGCIYLISVLTMMALLF